MQVPIKYYDEKVVMTAYWKLTLSFYYRPNLCYDFSDCLLSVIPFLCFFRMKEFDSLLDVQKETFFASSMLQFEVAFNKSYVRV